MSKIKITWKKSTIGYSHRQRKVIESLGLKRLNHTVEHEKTDSIMGMVNKVKHLVDVIE
ncbi:MAG: 50S ribosomal protein L30 [SAR202 cluster bacterium]|nr:50S ribosomal protein L30 [SAR202 cluster bacterium]|tara:strand:+ start:1314 stop:1490 length:177 start_codon:yes stop_codon:yes gene_type:complete